MDTKRQSFLNQTLEKIPANTVVLSSWLKKQGVSNDLQQRYKKNGWLKPVGKGAFLKFSSDCASVEGALYALQKQANLNVHIGGLSALTLNGKAHYVRVKNSYQLFAYKKTLIPKWIREYNFGKDSKIEIHKTSFLPLDLGLKEYDVNGNYKITIATPERAMLETLYLTPKNVNIDETFKIFEGLSGLKPTVLQPLLENCSSIKVKRLFLFFADKFDFAWLKYLNLKKIDLGEGKRSIIKGGKLDKKYNIVVGGIDFENRF